MSKLNELMEKRAQLTKEARAICEKETVSAEDQAIVDRMFAEVDNLSAQCERLSKLETVERSLGESQGRKTTPETRSIALPGNVPDESESKLNTKEYRKSFNVYLRRGASSLTGEQYRALTIGSDPAGGYLTFDEFEKSIVTKMQNLGVMRNLATILKTAGDHNIPVENVLGAATWVAEGVAYTESDPSYARVVLGAYKLGRIEKVSEELVHDSAFDLNAHLATKFANSFNAAEETAFVAGSGAGQPTGILTALSGNLFTTAGSGAITYDDLVDAFHSVKAVYRSSPKCAWILSDSTIQTLRKLKQSKGAYGNDNTPLWQPGAVLGAPDLLLGKPVYASDGCPAFAANTVVGCFGDISYYWIADRGNRSMQVLIELFAGSGQIGYRMGERVDGNLTLVEAVKGFKVKA